MDPNKKVSFGFNKLQKKKTILHNKPVEKDKVELIECVEEQSIKIKDAPPKTIYTPLVIPMENNKNLFDRITKDRQNDHEKEKPEEDKPNTELTIDELAVQELINDAKKRLHNNEPSKSLLSITEDKNSLDGAEQSTLDDYEKIPVSEFGMAMLRGMGWKEGMGIDKKATKFEPAKMPKLQPSGLGLGAKMIKSEPVYDESGNMLILKRGTYAKIIGGSHKGNYCEVQELKVEVGRVIVKTSLHGIILNLAEMYVVPVTKEEYLKNSRGLNNTKYEDYKKVSDPDLESYRKSKGIKSESETRNESGSSRTYKAKKDKYSDLSRSQKTKKRQ